MLLYRGDTKQFTTDVINNRIADIMADTFESSVGHCVQQPEFNAWNNSCQHLKNLISLADLTDNMIVLEYEVPFNTGRIDCLLFGKGEHNHSYVVLIELKQWTQVKEIDDEENVVETYTGGGQRKAPHPAQQVEGYHNHLINFVQVFEVGNDYQLYSCAYCHNYEKNPGRGLFAERYQKLIEQFPVYCKEDVQKLAEKLKKLLAKGNGFEIFNRFMQSPIKPSKKLLENVGKIVDQNKAVFSLLNEQLVAKNVIMAKIRKAEKKGEKNVVIVQGGPGTGKTVIAVNLLADLAQKKKSVFYGCKSKPFREALMKAVGAESRIMFSNLSRFVPARVDANSIDVVLIDEAHRIARNSNSQYTKKADRTDMSQVEQLIRCAKTAVFFIDDKQGVRHQEVGSTQLILDVAAQCDAACETVQLVSQFRCAGSDNFLDWIEFVLGYTARPINLTKDERYEFKIANSPAELYEFIKAHEQYKPNSARLVAGYCWPWSDPASDGNLVPDVKIGDFQMPWEARDVPGLKRGIPKWYQWAFKTQAVEQVGCIYTAQGFEFDYIGVIVGPDLKYDAKKNRLVADISATCDQTLKRNPETFETYVRNIYRVLMTRGLKGCYVYFCDKEVEAYFRKHIEGDPDFKEALMYSDVISAKEEKRIRLETDIDKHLEYVEYLPVFTAEAACGQFGEGQLVEKEGWIKVSEMGRLNRNMFVVRAAGKSMTPVICDGDYCVFQAPVVGTRNNKLVLVQHRGISDPETGGQYTIKKYTSKKTFKEDGSWSHEEISLNSLNADFKTIVIKNPEEQEFIVIGELMGIIGKTFKPEM
ncbi:MAG: DNA/RNA helicase domain-containing protein [Candidatus Omnitrophota bacterium]|jgi:hypothetical protein